MSHDRGGSVLPVASDLERRVLQARRRLPAAPESAADARRFVRETLCAAHRDELVDVTELAVSEVVANATLHARTAVELWVGVGEHDVCVEVRDFSPVLPVPRDYDSQATTGRGMGLVSALAAACGVYSLGDDGKVVWFRVSDAPVPFDPDDLLAAWQIGEAWDAVGAGGAAHDVMLLSMPATLWLSARQHHDALIREVLLYQATQGGLQLDLAAADAARAVISAAVVDAVDRERAAGTAEPAVPVGHPSPLPWVPKQLDLRITVGADAARTFAALQDVLDAGERLAVDGQLLLRPALPEIVAVRDWACEQVIAQLAGNPPSPWPGTDQERFERAFGDGEDPPVPDWDPATVTNAATGVIAADDANRIIAISGPLAALLGWDPGELVGRRVVALIPPALREAHVAGFTRHLTTGESHVLGVPLDLPILHKDGSEVVCQFLIERASLNQGRAVYVAWIDPVDSDVTSASRQGTVG